MKKAILAAVAATIFAGAASAGSLTFNNQANTNAFTWDQRDAGYIQLYKYDSRTFNGDRNRNVTVDWHAANAKPTIFTLEANCDKTYTLRGGFITAYWHEVYNSCTKPEPVKPVEKYVKPTPTGEEWLKWLDELRNTNPDDFPVIEY